MLWIHGWINKYKSLNHQDRQRQKKVLELSMLTFVSSSILPYLLLKRTCMQPFHPIAFWSNGMGGKAVWSKHEDSLVFMVILLHFSSCSTKVFLLITVSLHLGQWKWPSFLQGRVHLQVLKSARTKTLVLIVCVQYNLSLQIKRKYINLLLKNTAFLYTHPGGSLVCSALVA